MGGRRIWKLSGPARGLFLTRSSVELLDQEDQAGVDLFSFKRKWMILSVWMRFWTLQRRQARGAMTTATGRRMTGTGGGAEETERGGRITTELFEG